MLIDTHCHLNFPDYKKDLKAVINRAIKNDVKAIICASSNLADAEKAIQISKTYPGVVYVAIGIHPQQTDPENKTPLKKQLEQLTRLAKEEKVVAIGECGLDYSKAPPGEKDRNKKNQLFLFKEQIKLAQKFDLPLIVHSRKAFDETIERLKKLNGLKGVFHCYSGGKKRIEKVNQLGFYFGIDGNLTYDEGLQNVSKLIPLEKILLETDAPLLSPEPFRGQRNEPKNIKTIAESLAKIKNISFKKIAQITTQNSQKLLNLHF